MTIQASARPSCAAVRPRGRRVGSGHPLQIDLFDDGLPISRMETPSWQELPEEARGTLTSLMTLLILHHARASGTCAGTEAGHDL